MHPTDAQHQGTGVAAIVSGIGAGSGLIPGHLTDDVFGGVAVATSLAGLITVALLSEGMDAPRDDQIPVRVGFGPTSQGTGAIATLSGDW